MEPEIILGPPGTGKTTTLLGMVDEELSWNTPSERIGFVSFTRRAADEAKDRAKEKFQLKDKDLPWFRTIHSLCFSALGLSSAEVIEGRKLVEFGDWIGVKISGKVSLDEGATFGFEIGDRCLFMDNLARVRNVSLRSLYEEDSDDLPWNVVERVAKGYAEYKKEHGLHDFTDMLHEFLHTEWSARLEVLFVDESQDLSAIQWEVVRKLAKGARRVVIAGDDDQAIYRWAGADVDQFVELPGNVTVLTQSWRVPPAIQNVSNEMIARVKHRRAKSWKPREGETGEVVRVGSLDDIDFDVGADIMVLARNTCFLKDDAMPLLRSLGIIYGFRGGNSVRQSLVDAIVEWERLRKGEAVPVHVAEKIYDQFRVGEGFQRGHKKLPFWEDRDALITIQHLKADGGLLTEDIWHEAMGKLSSEDKAYMLKALKRGEKFRRNPTVRLSTIHGSKGGEADHVILLTDMAFRTFQESQRSPEDEARCWYVAVTRAKKKLTIVKPQTRRAYDI